MGATRCVRPGWRYPFFEIALMSDIVGLAAVLDDTIVVPTSFALEL